MVAQPGTGQQSMNAGEFAPDLAGRVDIKQYYSAGLRYQNIEPVPQAGFRGLPGTRRIQLVGASSAPRFWRLKRSRTDSYLLGLLPGRLDIFNGTTRVAQPAIASVTASIASEASVYAEADTIGIFHQDLKSVRLLRQSDAVWNIDDWPYQKIPEVDYGGSYPTTPDQWTANFRWAENILGLTVTFQVNGEQTNTISYQNTGQPADNAAFSLAVKNAIEALPSIGPNSGLQVAMQFADASNSSLIMVFGGGLAGEEFDLTCQITNTSEASVLLAHVVIGETRGEAAISPARGWPGFVTIVQDRLVYASLKSKPSGLLLSQTGEYFNVNIKAQRDDGAKLEAIRTNSVEEILHVKDSKYLLVFTDEAEYFASDRTIEREKASNFVRTSQNGLARGTWPVEIENRMYYIAQRGNVLFSTAYDDIASAFTARMESLLASHLVDQIMMSDVQRGTDDTDAARLWLLRTDGRLIGATIIRDQEITAFFEYDVGDPVRSIGVDAMNRLWLCVERSDGLAYEIMQSGSQLFSSVTKTADASGRVSGLHHAAGATVWCETSDGYTLGPFVVADGSIETDWPGATMTVGEWVPPIWESMPRVLVTRDDRIVRRPGRIHTLGINVIETTSIAVGANGTAPKDASLLRVSDPVDAPMPPKTELVTVAGIDGVKPDTTAVITQLRPGRLRVRDVTFEEKL